MSQAASNCTTPQYQFQPPKQPFPPTPPTHEPLLADPVTHLPLVRQTVSEKLLENRLRRMQIALAEAEHKENLIQRRRMKEQQIEEAIKGRATAADKAREFNIKQTFSVKAERERVQEERGQVRFEQYEANLQKIEKGRIKAQERQNHYVLRIQNREMEKTNKVFLKRRRIQAAEQKKTDVVHFHEWNNYKQYIVQKHHGQPRGPPDRLYQQRKTAQTLLKAAALNKTSEPVESQLKTEKSQIEPSCNKPGTSKSTGSVRTLMRRSRRAEYFGVHEEDMVQRTVSEMGKLRNLIEQHSLKPANLQQQPEVVQLFEEALLAMLH